ncbi:MAG: PAC2 family protein [Propionibacteriaceae bacterium]|nr:PAC2 family protein [Propionibacteriaceae bacterium]
MLDPSLLFTYESPIDQRTVHARTLVVTLGSYLDAGHAQRLIDEHLLNTLPNHKLGHFDIDQVFDYAGHRPHVTFDHDHFTDFKVPEIVLHQLTDHQGRPFLLLTGPEPALQWERMAAAVEHIIMEFDIQQTVLIHGFPAPSPHTRPVLVTQFASDPDLVPIRSGIPAAFEMSASFDALLTIRLGEKNHAVIGLSAHVPHYLTGIDYPDAAIALLHSLTEVTSLSLPKGELDSLSRMTHDQIDSQVNDSGELQSAIEAMEQHYDALVKDRGLPIKPEDLPTADEIGAELENFLRGLDDPKGQGDTGLSLFAPTDLVPPTSPPVGTMPINPVNPPANQDGDAPPETPKADRPSATRGLTPVPDTLVDTTTMRVSKRNPTHAQAKSDDTGNEHRPARRKAHPPESPSPTRRDQSGEPGTSADNPPKPAQS